MKNNQEVKLLYILKTVSVHGLFSFFKGLSSNLIVNMYDSIQVPLRQWIY